jgi:hypothetical protein
MPNLNLNCLADVMDHSGKLKFSMLKWQGKAAGLT